MKTLKQAELYLVIYETHLDVIKAFRSSSSRVYNEDRGHSALGYLTPSELGNAIAIDPSIASRFELQL